MKKWIRTDKPCIIMATSLEAEPFINKLNLKKQGTASFEQFINDHILLMISGMGKTNAAIAATYCCERYKPGCVINMGAAGATDTTHPLGSIVHIHKIFEHDRPRFSNGKPHLHKPDRLKGFPTATLATGDRPVIHPDERKTISSYAGLVDMEAAPIAQTCNAFKTKCYVFKYVSDTAEHTGGREIIKNMIAYREPFFDFFVESIMPRIVK